MKYKVYDILKDFGERKFGQRLGVKEDVTEVEYEKEADGKTVKATLSLNDTKYFRYIATATEEAYNESMKHGELVE